MEEVYNRAAIELRQNQAPTLARVRELLQPIYIPDDEFEADFSAIRFKNRGAAAKRLRYILVKLEKQLEPEDLADEAMAATVEHVLPENADATKWGGFNLDEHQRNFERLGNCSLLEKGLNNQEAADRPFSEKREFYTRSQYRLSRDLAAYQEWTADTISARQAAMAKVAKAVWKL